MLLKKMIHHVMAITVIACTNTIVYANDGVWYDAKNNLTWMRCTIGQTWSGSTCYGQAIDLSWEDAMEYPSLFNENGYADKHDWRLPTIAELLTLRRCSNGWAHYIKRIGDLSKDMGIAMVSISKGKSTIQVPESCDDGSSQPALDVNIFPNFPSERSNPIYWSSSRRTACDCGGKYVSFGLGGYETGGNILATYILLVRGGK